jgi:hypothetical protein
MKILKLKEIEERIQSLIEEYNQLLGYKKALLDLKSDSDEKKKNKKD